MNISRKQRHKRIRAKIVGSAKRPRLFVYRSNTHIYASLIDDQKMHTLVSVSDQKSYKETVKGQKKSTKKERAYQIGLLLAEIEIVGVTEVVTAIVIAFDVAVVGNAHVALEVNTHVTICPFVSVDVRNVALFVPAFIPK